MHSIEASSAIAKPARIPIGVANYKTADAIQNVPMSAPHDVAIVGAGAAGLATAIFTGARCPGARVVLLDGARSLGAKILVSGGVAGFEPSVGTSGEGVYRGRPR